MQPPEKAAVSKPPEKGLAWSSFAVVMLLSLQFAIGQMPPQPWSIAVDGVLVLSVFLLGIVCVEAVARTTVDPRHCTSLTFWMKIISTYRRRRTRAMRIVCIVVFLMFMSHMKGVKGGDMPNDSEDQGRPGPVGAAARRPVRPVLCPIKAIHPMAQALRMTPHPVLVHHGTAAGRPVFRPILRPGPVGAQ